MKYYIWTFFVIFFVSFIALSTYAAQMRTTETVVVDSDVAVSSSVDYPFTLYIGDDLSGVTAPALKSLHFTVSGVYEGGGTLALSLDSDGATTKTYTLPSVSKATTFEINYKDPSYKINPTSGGSYDYTLNYVPSGVTVYGLSIKMEETHKYTPSSCADGQQSNQKMKTTETVVVDSNVAVSSSEDYPFTLYIGDDLSGVTAPALKSLHFTVSGVYEGGGTLALSLDSDGATTKTYTLPSVTQPTTFEINYKDPSYKINPTSGGSYDYTLNYAPSGVTVYGLSIKMEETHRYKPPSCGGLPVLGELISPVFDSTGTSDGAAYNSILWKGVLGQGDTGKVRFQFAASASDSGSWEYYGGDTCGSSDWFETTGPDSPVELKEVGCDPAPGWNNKRYFRYKVQICSLDCIDAGEFTPVIDDIIVNWAP